MRPDDVALLVKLCRSRAALRVEPDRTYINESRLAPLARREGLGSIEGLFDVLRAKREDRLIWALVEAMALGETAFFRDKAPFDAFRDQMLPVLSRRRDGAPIRIWSAGCATGQETYSLAMIAEDCRFKAPDMRVEVFGSDLSERALEKAQSGLYTQFEVQRGLPIRALLKHFEKHDDMWAISPRIRQAVRWRRMNLAADLRGVGRFDVIFCRNVISLLDASAHARVLESLAMLLPEDGYLVLGEKERPDAATNALRPVGDGVYARDPAFRAAA